MDDWKSKLGAAFGIDATAVPEADEAAPAPAGDALSQQGKVPVHVLLDRKGRRGKTATLVTDLLADDEAVADLARELKQLCGVGGSSRGGEILIQGDQLARVTAHLRQRGFKVK